MVMMMMMTDIEDSEMFVSPDLFLFESSLILLNLRPFDFSCSNIVPWINVSGRGGHPGTYTSTGIIPSTPGSTLYESIYNPPVIAHAPIAITYFGSGILL